VTNGRTVRTSATSAAKAHIPAFPSEPKDLTERATCLPAFLYGITHGVSPDKARAARFLSHKVIIQVGARLHHGTRVLGRVPVGRKRLVLRAIWEHSDNQH
jgi:hypothetical protein